LKNEEHNINARAGKLVVVSGPSGVGKSTINREAMRRTNAAFSVSVTTRPPRAGEIDGGDYFFVDRETFKQRIEQDAFLEWADVFGNYYGTLSAPVEATLAAGGLFVLEIDVQGAMQVHKKMPDATFVLVVPPSMEELKNRLIGRGTEDEESLQRRLGKSEAELKLSRDSGIYTHQVVNDDVETAVADLITIFTETTPAS
jgi:guanylate kinase